MIYGTDSTFVFVGVSSWQTIVIMNLRRVMDLSLDKVWRIPWKHPCVVVWCVKWKCNRNLIASRCFCFDSNSCTAVFLAHIVFCHSLMQSLTKEIWCDLSFYFTSYHCSLSFFTASSYGSCFFSGHPVLCLPSLSLSPHGASRRNHWGGGDICVHRSSSRWLGAESSGAVHWALGERPIRYSKS